MDGKQVGKRHPFAELKHAGNGTNGRGSATIVSIVTHVYNCLPAALKRVGIRRASASFELEEFRLSRELILSLSLFLVS